MDRNEKARHDFQLATERRRFQQAFAAGVVFVTDRFGNRIEPGDVAVYLPPAAGIVVQVGAVTPVLDPGVQPGFVRLTLVTEIPLTYRSGTVASDLLIMRKQAQIQAELQGQQAAAASSPDGPVPAVEDGHANPDAIAQAEETSPAAAASEHASEEPHVDDQLE